MAIFLYSAEIRLANLAKSDCAIGMDFLDVYTSRVLHYKYP